MAKVTITLTDMPPDEKSGRSYVRLQLVSDPPNTELDPAKWTLAQAVAAKVAQMAYTILMEAFDGQAFNVMQKGPKS